MILKRIINNNEFEINYRLDKITQTLFIVFPSDIIEDELYDFCEKFLNENIHLLKVDSNQIKSTRVFIKTETETEYFFRFWKTN